MSEVHTRFNQLAENVGLHVIPKCFEEFVHVLGRIRIWCISHVPRSAKV